jgi:hypothetical protein
VRAFQQGAFLAGRGFASGVGSGVNVAQEAGRAHGAEKVVINPNGLAAGTVTFLHDQISLFILNNIVDKIKGTVLP